MDEVWKLQVRALAIWKREGSPEGLPNQFNPMAEEKLAHVSSRTTDPVGMTLLICSLDETNSQG